MADIEILKGKTFSLVLRPETAEHVYAPITGITKAAPPVITATAHGVPDGWRVAVVSVKGMTQINAEGVPPKSREYTEATVVDANTVKLNKVNASEYSTYTSGGYIQYFLPMDMAGGTVRMKIKDRVGGTVLASTEVGDAPLNTLVAAIDTTACTATVTMAADDTAAITWARGVTEVEFESTGGVVTSFLPVTPVTAVDEVVD